MVATKYAYSKGKKLVRSLSAVFSIFFGLFALFFTATPKLWNAESSNQNIFTNFFTQNTAHADIPHNCFGGGGGGGGGGADSGGASGCAGACADGSAGSCACGDGGGCGTGGATA